MKALLSDCCVGMGLGLLGLAAWLLHPVVCCTYCGLVLLLIGLRLHAKKG